MIDEDHKVAKILQCLLIGMDIELDGRTWTLCESDTGELSLSMQMQSSSGQTVYMPSDMPLGYFIKFARKMDDDSFSCLVASLTLIQMNREKAKAKKRNI